VTEGGTERRSVPRASRVWIRFRERFRSGLDRLLAAHLVWSVAFAGVATILLGSQQCGSTYLHWALG